jgi:hypothetical protein
MPTKPTRLEAEIAEIADEFVQKIVSALRNASFVDVAGFDLARARATRTVGRPARTSPEANGAKSPPSPGRPRQTAGRRAELGNRILDALSRASEPMGVRAIASEVGVAADVLSAPLRELRAEGRIDKHGDKRSTTYSRTRER